MIGPHHRCPGGLLRFALDDHLSMRIYPHAHAVLLSEAAPDPLHTLNDTDLSAGLRQLKPSLDEAGEDHDGLYSSEWCAGGLRQRCCT